MTYEVYQMVPAGTEEKPKPEVYQMTPSGTVEQPKPEVYQMVPIGQPITGAGAGGVTGPTVWTLYDASEEFQSDHASASFNTIPGDWSGVSPAYIITAPAGYTKARIVGFNGAWTYTAAAWFCGSLWLKSAAQAQLGGSGTLYASAIPAAAEWKTVDININLGADRKFGWGYNNPAPVVGAIYLQFRVYLA